MLTWLCSKYCVQGIFQLLQKKMLTLLWMLLTKLLNVMEGKSGHQHQELIVPSICVLLLQRCVCVWLSVTSSSLSQIHKFYIQIVEKKSELAKLEAIDCGKPLEEAAWDMVC